MQNRTAVVIGAGVNGLSTAIELLEKRFDVHLVAESFNDTTSHRPAALFEPYLAGNFVVIEILLLLKF